MDIKRKFRGLWMNSLSVEDSYCSDGTLVSKNGKWNKE